MDGAARSLSAESGRAALPVRIQVWDLPTRLFHWALVAFIIIACISARVLGEEALRIHFFSGYVVLTLVGFRVLWGFAGSQTALFGQFVRGPATTARYLLSLLRRRADARISHVGHNPLGALSILALLAISAALAVSGLFASDYVASQGPLARLVSEKMVGRSSSLHAWSEPVLYALVVMHLSAIAFYRFARRENLVGPMLTGYKLLRDPSACGQDPTLPSAKCEVRSEEFASDGGRCNWRALLLFALNAALVTYLIGL